MKIEHGYSVARQRIMDAKSLLEMSAEHEWPADRRLRWATILNDIEKFLDAPVRSHQFSIIRSLDASGRTEGPIADAIIEVSRELMRSGIDQFR